MKLYYTPGACSLAPHIAIREAGLPVDLVKVDLAAKRLEDGSDYKAVNPKGYVPALRVEDGSVLAEAAAVLQYVADKAPAGRLRPERDTPAYYRYLEWLTFVSSEIHKGFGPLWKPDTPAEVREKTIATLKDRFALLDRHLATNQYLNGSEFTAADAYLFTVTNWASMHKVDLSPYPNLVAYRARVGARPAVQDAMGAEGLLKAAA